MSNPEVSGLAFHPIKGAAATIADEVSFTEMGIKYDREWLVCSPEGSFMSQRKEPQLAVVKPTILDDGLVVDAPGMETLFVDFETEGEEKEIDFFKKSGMGRFQGEEAAEWLSTYLNKPAELFRVTQPRTVKPECQVDGATTQVGFADAFPLLIVSQASLAELNTHLDDPVTIDRFRGNIVVSGNDLEPYEEDYWREVRVGELSVFVVRACARCPVPNTDQTTGVRDGRTVTDALKATRNGVDLVNGSKGHFFGQNGVHVFEPGVTVKIGDEVVIMDRDTTRNLDLSV